jgi:hypothetical protein
VEQSEECATISIDAAPQIKSRLPNRSIQVFVGGLYQFVKLSGNTMRQPQGNSLAIAMSERHQQRPKPTRCVRLRQLQMKCFTDIPWGFPPELLGVFGPYCALDEVVCVQLSQKEPADDITNSFINSDCDGFGD